MQLYNTLHRRKEEFTPLKDSQVSVYSCGPTVYDRAHIGNLSSFIYANTLVNTLLEGGQKVNWVMNFTDVDDKTIKRSQQQYAELEPKEALTKLTRAVEKDFTDDLESVGVKTKLLTFVRATESIEPMQKLISELHEQGFAYIADDGVYFSIEAYKQSGKTYGQLTHIDSQNTSQARISNDEYDKDSVHDFALWKKATAGEPSWDFSIDGHDMSGRPGWHIECSAMSSSNLGQPFDIHTGGVDLIFPHHENEIAQSTAGKANPIYAQSFVHSEHLLIDGRKMSKSLNNFFTLDDIIKKGFDPLAFRLMVLQSHYRSQGNFTWEILAAAQNRLNELRAWADLRHQPSSDTMPPELDELFRDVKTRILQSMEDDLNTPQALSHLGELVSYMLKIPIPGVEGKYTDGTLAFLDRMFGLDLSNRPDITDEQKQLLAERQAARDNKDWQKSDELRDTLKQEKLDVRDTDHGQVWSRL